jgi:hypothetical protein
VSPVDSCSTTHCGLCATRFLRSAIITSICSELGGSQLLAFGNLVCGEDTKGSSRARLLHFVLGKDDRPYGQNRAFDETIKQRPVGG